MGHHHRHHRHHRHHGHNTHRSFFSFIIWIIAIILIIIAIPYIIGVKYTLIAIFIGVVILLLVGTAKLTRYLNGG